MFPYCSLSCLSVRCPFLLVVRRRLGRPQVVSHVSVPLSASAGVALLRLAKLFERLNEPMRAAAAYADYIRDSEGQDIWDRDEQAQAYRFMANHFLLRGQLDETAHHAARCTEFPETREEGKAILREVAQRRAEEAAARGAESAPASAALAATAEPGETPLGMSPLPPYRLLFSP